MSTEPVITKCAHCGKPDHNISKCPDVDLAKVMARVQKILTLGRRGGTEGEAEGAMAMAQEIMAKYNLDMAQVEASGSLLDPNTNQRVKEQMSGRAMYKWQRELARYTAEANFCFYLLRNKYQSAHYTLKGKALTDDEHDALGDADRAKVKFVSGKDVKTHIFVGRKGNVVTAQLMYKYLCETIEDLVPIENNTQRLSNSAMSWKEGCADRLCERLSRRRKDLIKEHDERVKAEQEANREAMAKAAAERAAKTPKALKPHHESEVKAQFEGSASEAYDAVRDVPEADDPERPEDTDEVWSPEGDEVEKPEAGAALVLASVYDESEKEANYEMAHGYEPGTLARWRREAEERDRERAEESATEQVEEVEKPVKAETERQRKARERREQDEYAKRRRRWAREDQTAANRAAREFAKRDHRAYAAGARKGADIGLDGQLNAGKAPKKLGG